MGLHADGSIDLTTILTAPNRPAELDKVFEGATDDLQESLARQRGVARLPDRHADHALGDARPLAVRRPGHAHRNADAPPRTDALEFALITLLIVMFSPLSFNYAFVWLIYPITVALNEVLEHPAPAGRRRKLQRAGLAAILLIPALAVPMPLYAQAWGNLFVPALLLVFSLGWTLLRRAGTSSSVQGAESAPHDARAHAAVRAGPSLRLAD